VGEVHLERLMGRNGVDPASWDRQDDAVVADVAEGEVTVWARRRGQGVNPSPAGYCTIMKTADVSETFASSSRSAYRTRLAVAAVAAAALAVPTAAAAPASAAPTTTVVAVQRHYRPAEVALPAGLRPEGITSGPGHTSKVLLPGATGRQIRGLYFDRRTGLIWAAGNVGTEAHVWAVSSRTGKVVQDTVVPGAVFLNDLVVTRKAVWVTDSRRDRLTVIRLSHHGRPTGKAPTFLALTGAWPAGDGTAINANGIRQLPDGSAILNNSRVGGLWRVDPKTGHTHRIPVSGGPGIVGGDGLELRGATLYNVRGSGPNQVSVLRLRHDDSEWTARWRTALTDARLDVPTTATLSGGTLWAVNARFGTPNPDTAAYWITPLGGHRR
jgi:hypothetical protein